MISTFLFMLYSMPSFWVATMLIMFLGGGDYLDWFPGYGVGEWDTDASLIANLGNRAYHLILPLICMTYGSLAFLSRQMRGAVIGSLSQDYIRTARAKGLSQMRVVVGHALRNSLIPLTTLFGLALGGSLIGGAFFIEVLLGIPGLGRLGYETFQARDFPVTTALVILTALTIAIANLAVDIAYPFIDPRIRERNV